MESSRWDRVKDVFAAASELDADSREAYLRVICADEPEVIAEVQRLLGHDDSRGLLADHGSALDLPIPETQVFEPGDVVAGRFQILRCVGRGGMGEVYEAEDRNLGERVALKTMRLELSGNARSVARLKRETHLARRVTHRNICRIYDSGTHEFDQECGSHAFLTMEFVAGRTLAEELRQPGGLGPGDALSVIRQIGEGLRALHEAGIVHRDLKPNNVMLARSGGALERVILTDFGLAQDVISPARIADQVTETSQVIGTPGYMAPEQFGGRPLGPYSDIYAYGIILQQLLSVIPEGTAGAIKSSLAATARKCTAYQPEDRIQNGLRLCLELDEMLANAGVSARGPTPRGFAIGHRITAWAMARIWLPLNRNWITRAAAVLTLVSAGPLLGALLIPDFRSTTFRAACGALPGNSLFCLLPDDRDLAIMPFSMTATTPEGELIGRGFERYFVDNLTRLYPNPERNCVHPRNPGEVYAEKLVLAIKLKVEDSGIRVETKLTDAADGRLLRTLVRTVSLDDLEGLTAKFLDDTVQLAGLEIPKEQLTGWQRAQAHSAEAFKAYLRGLAYFHQTAPDAPDSRAAAREFARALATSGSDLSFAAASVSLGDAYRLTFQETGDHSWAAKSENAYRQALTAPDFAPGKRSWGQLDVLRGRTEDGISHLKDAVRLEPFDRENRSALADALKSAGRLNEAEAVLLEGARIHVDCWYFANALAGFYVLTGRYDKSERQLLRVIELAPSTVAAYSNLGRIYLEMGRYDDSVQASAKATSLHSRPQAYSTLGRALMNRGCVKQGLANLRHATKIGASNLTGGKPDRYQFVYLSNLGEALLMQGGEDPEIFNVLQQAAAGAAQRLLERSNDEDALRVRTRSLTLLGRTREAFRALELLRSVNPGGSLTAQTAALVYESAGMRAKSLAEIKRALERGMPVYELRHIPVLHKLVNSPDYRELLAKLDLDATREAGATSGGANLSCPESMEPGRGLRLNPTSGARARSE